MPTVHQGYCTDMPLPCKSHTCRSCSSLAAQPACWRVGIVASSLLLHVPPYHLYSVPSIHWADHMPASVGVHHHGRREST